MANTEVMKKERLDHYVLEAAKAAGYEQGFGIIGCDLKLNNWWVAYARQSTLWTQSHRFALPWSESW